MAAAEAATESPAEPELEPDVPRKRKEEAGAAQGGLDQLCDFLTSREGKRVQKKVMRGVFGMLRKRL